MKYIYRITIICALLLLSNSVFAGTVAITKLLPATNDLKVGDEVLIELDLVSGGTQYNAIEGSLFVSPIFEINKVITGNSFVSVWLNSPSVFEGNTINFSGIAPAGYNKEVGPIFSLILLSKDVGSGTVALKNVGIFKNDGLGTRENIAEKSFALSVRAATEDEIPYLVSVKDETPPEEFNIELVKDPGLYGGWYAIVWSALDKGSGIKSYDVLEGRRVFKQAESPYVLEKQSLGGKIYVKAYDYEGNVRTAVFTPPGKFCAGDSCFGRGYVAGMVIIVVAGIYLIWRKKKRA